MLTISDTRHGRHCQGFSRRDYLRVGSPGLLGGGMTLADLLRVRAAAPAGRRPAALRLTTPSACRSAAAT